MDIAERVSQIIRELPEAKAAEIPDFAEFLKARRHAGAGDSVAVTSSHECALAEFRANPIKVKTFTPLGREAANAR